MPLDAVVSPPTFLFGTLIWPRPMWPLTLIHVTFDLMVNVHHHTKFGDPTSSGSLVMNFSGELFSSDFWSGGQTDRWTGRKRCITAHHALAQMAKKFSNSIRPIKETFYFPMGRYCQVPGKRGLHQKPSPSKAAAQARTRDTHVCFTKAYSPHWTWPKL